jgi:hypothetical protein
MPAISPLRALFAAAVVVAPALLGTFIHIVRQATDAGASRYLSPAKATAVARVDGRPVKAAPAR